MSTAEEPLAEVLHMCQPSKLAGVVNAHLAQPGFEVQCQLCGRVWRVTKTHHTVRGRDVCGCGWACIYRPSS